MTKSDEAWPLGAQLKNPVTVKRMPDWATSSDVVVRRGKRYFLVSTHEPERRWRQWLRWLRRSLNHS